MKFINSYLIKPVIKLIWYLCTVSETTAMLYIGNFASFRIKSHLQEFKVNLLKKMLVRTRSYMYRLNRSMLILSPFNRVLNFNIEQLYWDYKYLISRGVFFLFYEHWVVWLMFYKNNGFDSVILSDTSCRLVLNFLEMSKDRKMTINLCKCFWIT